VGAKKKGKDEDNETRGMYTGVFPTKPFPPRRPAPVNFQIKGFGYGRNIGYGKPGDCQPHPG